jgi:hypothetical protein
MGDVKQVVDTITNLYPPVITFPETEQRLQQDDTTERQGDFVKQKVP